MEEGRHSPAAKTGEPFVVMAKPVGPRCNLACSYCYYLKTETEDKSPAQTGMSDELLEVFIRQYIAASPGPVVQFVWHGGEPTLAGLDFYRRAVALQKAALPEGWSCWNNLQTNGILLDDEWCAFLAEARFDVGLSIDGTQALHDSHRKDRGGGGSYSRAEAAVRRLQGYGLQPDLLCTVTSQAAEDPVAVYQALAELGTGWMQFIPIVERGPDGGLTPDSVTGEAYGRFLTAVFDRWLLHDLGRLEVQLFAEMARVLSGGTASLCWMAPTCGRVLVVEEDGGVYSCDHFVTPRHRIGDIVTQDLGTLVDIAEQRRFGSDKRDGLPALCRACRWLSLCNGGCPKDRFGRTEDGEGELNHLCDGYRRFFAHAEEPLKRLIRRRKQGLSPQAVMAEFRGQLQARWKGVGRNDPCPCGSGRKAKHCCWAARP